MACTTDILHYAEQPPLDISEHCGSKRKDREEGTQVISKKSKHDLLAHHDVVEQILIRLDVEDLLRCKAVCKSWHSLISTPCFVTSHLEHAFNTDRKLGIRRSFVCDLEASEDECFYFNVIYIVGSYNGLVCFSPRDVKLVICNPSTREKTRLPPLPFRSHLRLNGVCWGFGYADDDYKVVAGFEKKGWTLFYLLTLKSNTWKFIGKVEYTSVDGKSGTLCGGALHWFMDHKERTVILSLDLSTQKFKEIPQPGAEYGYKYSNCHVRLGVIEEECLCICSNPFGSSNNKKWVMKNNKWELYVDGHGDCPSKYDVAHCWIKTSSGRRIHGDAGGTRMTSDEGYATASIFVKSLVSPHLHEKGQEDIKNHTEGNIRKKKKKKKSRKRSCKHIINKPLRLWY